MTPEEKALLLETHDLAEENNKLLRSLRRSRRIGIIMSVLYWVVIIGVSVGAFYFIQPYIDFLTGLGGDQSGASSYAQTLEDLLK